MEGPILISVIIVYDKKTNCILMGRRLNKEEKHLYGLPGGKVEAGEMCIDTARRECFEETGLKCLTLRRVGFVESFIHKHFCGPVFLTKEFEGILVNKEPRKCVGWEWVHLNAFPRPQEMTITLKHIIAAGLFSTEVLSKLSSQGDY